MIKKTLAITFTSCFFIQHICATLVTGDPNATAGNTFSFDIGHAKIVSTESEQTRLWLAAGEATSGDTQKYALSFVQRVSAEPLSSLTTGLTIIPTVTAMANPENATIYTYDSGTNAVNSTSTANPIYGAQFNLFDISGNKPVFTLGAMADSNLYVTHNIERYETPTAGKSNITELLLHDLTPGKAVAISTTGSDIYVAHAPGTFGGADSKITKFITDTKLQTDGSLPYLNKLAETTIDTTIEALRGGSVNDLASIGSSITFCHFAGLTYVGLSATAANNGNDKAAGIAILRTTINGTTLNLAFDKITNDAVISDTTVTAISAPDNATVRIKKITGMATSTSLHYLIVARDSGTGPQSIYAVPLVTQAGENYGKIADITASTSNPNNSFYINPNRFANRTLANPLTDPAQITPANVTYKEQLEVGGGPPPLENMADIKDMYAIGDTVYVVIANPYQGASPNDTKPGTLYSQAIFNVNGTIASWTPWARALGSDEPMLYSNVSPTSTINFYVSDLAGGTSFRKVVQTQWHINHNLSTFFKEAHRPKGIDPNKPGDTIGGGVQGLHNFSQQNPAVTDASFMIATGFNQITVGQTGNVVSGDFKVLKPVTTQSYNDINSSGALVAAELAKSGTNYWFFAGGATGLYTLTNSSGVTKAAAAFSDIADFDPTNKSWKKIGDYTFIKKLVTDNTTYLYVLTPTKLDKIELTSDKFTDTPASLDPITVIESSHLPGNPYLLDVIIDENFAILGTTNGMYSLDTNTTIATPISVPDGLPAISQLFVVSNNNEPQRNFTNVSNLYVLNNSFGTQEARLNRFLIKGTTITPFDDSLLGTNLDSTPQGIPTSLITFNNYVSNYFTNGSTNLASNYFLGTTQPSSVITPSMSQIFAGISNGKSSSHIINPMLSMPVSTLFLQNVNNFLGVTCESTSGALIAAGNFEARVNS